MHQDSETVQSHSRREFLKGSVAAGTVCVVVSYLDLAAAQPMGETLDAQPPQAPKSWENSDRTVPFRYDGHAKVMGKKIYARDLRARDLKGWPRQEQRVAILRVHHADRIFLGPDLERIKSELGVSRVVTGDQIEAAGVKPDGMFVSALMAIPGRVPVHLGQVAAILYFPDSDTFLDAQMKMMDTTSFLRYGAEAAPDEVKAYGKSRIVRYTDAEGKELFSYAKDGSFPGPWEDPDEKGSVNARAAFYASKVQSELQNPTWILFRASYTTQGIDPMFMEPECGLAWYDSNRKELQLTWGTQSPLDDGDACAQMLSQAKSIPLEKVVIHSCYPGGGFGGRDRSEFPLFLALAAVMSPNVPVRIVQSRFDQFQGGLKRHPAKTELELAIDKKGIFQAFHTDLKLDGAGQNNYSFAVQNVGARNASSAYRFPRSWVDSEATHSIAVPAGSMRGFGSFQSAFAMECLVDEAAAKLGIDPIELRLRNVITDPEPVHTGTIPRFRLNTDLLLKAAQKSPLWVNREKDKQTRSSKEKDYGVGFAVAVKSYGKNPGDACPAAVIMDNQGRLTVYTNSVDMGNGSSTTLPICFTDILGHKADGIKMGVSTEFEALELISSKPKDQAQQDEVSKNPRWVPSRAISTAASASAYQMRHAMREAARILLRFGLWPAAKSIWGDAAKNLEWDESLVSWQKGALKYKNQVPIPLKVLAMEVHKRGFVAGVMVHAFYRADWAKASFSIDSGIHEYAIDALALQRGKSPKWQVIPRETVQFPPLKNLAKGADIYTPYAVLVAVEVERSSGNIKVVGGETFLECGELIQKDIVEGQMHGAFAMGIGQTLMEEYPLTKEGPGQGGWNLHRYQVPRARDCAVGQVTYNIVQAPTIDPPKGMAEVVFNAVPPAIVNAVAHATGRRFYQLPLQAQKIKEVLS